MSKDDQHLTFACRLWILHRAPHVTYCELRPAANGFEIYLFFDGAMLMSRQFASLSDATICAQTELAELKANGWSRVDDD